MLRKILPHPFLTLLLIAVWQMLVNTVTLGNLLLGTILALIIPVITSPYCPIARICAARCGSRNT